MTRLLKLRLWWHNEVKLRWHNWTFRFSPLYREWVRQGRDPRFFPRAGKITPAALAWAETVTRRRDGVSEQETK